MPLRTVIAFLSCAVSVYSAEIAGQIRDPQGAVLAGARVRVFSGARTVTETIPGGWPLPRHAGRRHLLRDGNCTAHGGHHKRSSRSSGRHGFGRHCAADPGTGTDNHGGCRHCAGCNRAVTRKLHPRGYGGNQEFTSNQSQGRAWFHSWSADSAALRIGRKPVFHSWLRYTQQLSPSWHQPVPERHRLPGW